MVRSPGELLLTTLHQYMPPTTARIVLKSCLEPLRATPETLNAADLPRVVTALVSATRHFVQGEKREALAQALKAFGTPQADLEPATIQLNQENDLSEARVAARRLMELLGANSLQTQKAATAVSEISRNVLSYAKKGTLELVPKRGPPAKLVVRAVDQGPGIPNLEEILSGNYRSKTGMGLGLLGVKRISSGFVVHTGPSGTTVEFELFA